MRIQEEITEWEGITDVGKNYRVVRNSKLEEIPESGEMHECMGGNYGAGESEGMGANSRGGEITKLPVSASPGRLPYCKYSQWGMLCFRYMYSSCSCSVRAVSRMMRGKSFQGV